VREIRKDRPNRDQLFTRNSEKKETSMKGVETKKELSPAQREELLKAVKARFEKNINRHKGLNGRK
jgi:F0F1-type ATP synthase delta subunit